MSFTILTILTYRNVRVPLISKGCVPGRSAGTAWGGHLGVGRRADDAATQGVVSVCHGHMAGLLGGGLRAEVSK